jgi:beta-galactosidase GanA
MQFRPICAAFLIFLGASPITPPYLQRQQAATQLIVNGKPFLIRGGELGNSTAASLEYLKPFWPKFAAMHLNTILAPVYWDLTEPEEGKFDFTLIDGVIEQARQHDMHLVLLWFATWKNSMSCNAPAWVKTNQERFPRVKTAEGKSEEIVTPFSDACCNADATAFAALMKHLREIDSEKQTVLMVQVENEIGMIPDARDHSSSADEMFKAPVPKELLESLQKKNTGNWEEVFGKSAQTDEIFMAWHFAQYVETVAKRGKAEYPLPMYVNAALIRPNYPPGRYPSAGPLPHLMDIWRAGAPSIDFLSPDIYFLNFNEWCGKYDRDGNALFIPEVNSKGLAPVNVFYAMGQHNAIGFCPFAIESLGDPQADLLMHSYSLLEQLEPLIVANQGSGTMIGLSPEIHFDGSWDPAPVHVPLADYVLNVTYERTMIPPPTTQASVDPSPGLNPDKSRPPPPPTMQSDVPMSGGIIISLGNDEYLIAGTGLIVTFSTTDETIAGILSAQEGVYKNGDWIGGRWLSGDQTHQGRHIRIPPGEWGIQRVKLYRYR